ncbi:MAG: NAD-dependent epimerase/dehydratase family protein [Candidatus Delongbacteria bacterium]|jgi:UDP-glucuronate decarboxylase|nr:NAD-dependent epimerase/dehydratase family protein [Candidatus Delongbacteria bacterium]
MKKLKKYSRKILLTGGAGFIGSATAKKLIQDKDNFVVVVDDLSTGHIDKLPGKLDNFRFIKCDVNNYRDMLEIMLAYNVDFVFHYAAVVGVSRTQNHPIEVLNDVKGIENILTISKNIGVKRIFYASSSEVYGEPVEIPQNVYTTPLNSRLPYAIVKNLGEAYLKSFNKEFGMEYTIFRFFNTYGPMQTKDFVITRFLKMAMQNKDITIYGDGNQTRTFCYIDDNVDACVKIAYDNLFINDVINIGQSVETRIEDLAKLIIEQTGSKSKFVYLPPLKEGDMQRRCPDNTMMKEVLDRDLISLKKGLNNIIEEGLFEFEH